MNSCSSTINKCNCYNHGSTEVSTTSSTNCSSSFSANGNILIYSAS